MDEKNTEGLVALRLILIDHDRFVDYGTERCTCLYGLL